VGKNAPGGNIFGYFSLLGMVRFSNALRKKQMCWQEVPGRCVLTFKKVAERRYGAFWLNLSTVYSKLHFYLSISYTAR